MKELSIITHNGIETVDSREVAQAIESRHSDLLEKVSNYNSFLTNGKFRSLDFFIPSTYKDSKGEERPCYLLTKKGCDMVANKMTGEKGVLFTAAYVTAFEKMRETIAAHKLPPVTDYQRMVANTAAESAKLQKAQFLKELAGRYEGTTYQQILYAHATKELTGEFLLPLPKLKAKMYSAAEIGEALGISGNMVGRLAKAHDLKNESYGEWFKDKSPHSAREVETFRYYESIIPVLRSLLQKTA